MEKPLSIVPMPPLREPHRQISILVCSIIVRRCWFCQQTPPRNMGACAARAGPGRRHTRLGLYYYDGLCAVVTRNAPSSERSSIRKSPSLYGRQGRLRPGRCTLGGPCLLDGQQGRQCRSTANKAGRGSRALPLRGNKHAPCEHPHGRGLLKGSHARRCSMHCGGLRQAWSVHGNFKPRERVDPWQTFW